MPEKNPPPKTARFIYAGLALITLALYLPALRCDFVEYDDQQYVTENPRVQSGLTWAGLVWAFGFHAGNWHPLAWLSHMLDCQLFGALAWGHHLTSVVLHTATTLLLFAVLKRTTGFVWRSAAVAALFAWHPLHVESVAWVAERKDVLCAFFWMLTLLAYARYAGKKSPANYGLTLCGFGLALMAKPMAVTLPFVLLLLDCWPLKRISIFNFQFSIFKKLLLEKIPFFLMSAGACWLTLQAQELAIVSTAGLPVSQRLASVLIAYGHYLSAAFFPRHLAVYYPYQFHIPLIKIVIVATGLVLITVLGIKNLRSRPWLLIGWLWYLGTLVPVIGLVQVGDQAWADRYTYLPLIGVFVMLVWLAGEFITNRAVLRGIATLLGVVMLGLTSVQLTYWKNTRTLFAHAAAVTERNALAVTVLGSQFAKEGKLEEAMKHYHQALEYTPNFPEAHFFLGNALDEQGKLDEAVDEYERALWFKPTQEQTHIFMAIALAKQKKYDAAITHYSESIRLNPDAAAAHNNLARLYHTLGRFDDAIAHYTTALEIDPRLSIAHNNLGILLLQKGRFADGTTHLREAVRLRPKNAESKFNLARALNEQGQWGEAAEWFKQSAASYASDPKAHFEFASALMHLQRTREAMSEFAAALLIQPDFPDALDGLAWILATTENAEFRNGAEAVKLAGHACALTQGKDPEKLKTLAAALAETGRFDEAQTQLQLAHAAASKPEQRKLCERMAEFFTKSKPWRE
jgi:tetratricopeptide (TPR) repeat protein